MLAVLLLLPGTCLTGSMRCALLSQEALRVALALKQTECELINPA